MNEEIESIRLAVVTGSAHRLGRIFALTLAGCGYATLLHYHRSADKASSTEKEIALLGKPVFRVQADLSKPRQIDKLLSEIDAIPHPLHVLVNSASVMLPEDLSTISSKEWDNTFALNLRAPFLLAQGVARRMISGGLIVNVTDASALRTWRKFPAYVVSKAALEALTRIQARAYAPAIRVNAIAPGLVLPSENVTADEWRNLVNRLPLGRTASTNEISTAIKYLLENEYVTGQTLTVDGGYSLL